MPDSSVTIASTTDTQAEVNAAAGVVAEEQGEVAEQEQGAETEAESQAAPESSEEQHEEEKHTSKRSQKIKRLAGKLSETERERDEWRQKFEELQRGRTEPPKQETPTVDPYAYPVPKPKAGDFVNPQDFVEALTEWKVDEREYRAALKAQAEEQQAAQNEIRDSYGAQLAEAKAEHPDYAQVVGDSELKIWPEVETALRTHENGAELAYWLAKNPTVADRLAQMSPPRAVVELGAIASQLFRNNSAATPAQKPRIQPIKPVGGGTTKTAIDEPDNLPYQEWKKWYKANGGRR